GASGRDPNHCTRPSRRTSILFECRMIMPGSMTGTGWRGLNTAPVGSKKTRMLQLTCNQDGKDTLLHSAIRSLAPKNVAQYESARYPVCPVHVIAGAR